MNSLNHSFRLDIEANPNPTSFAIYADYVEETLLNPDLAFALRWMAKWEKWPVDRKKLPITSIRYQRIVSKNYRFAWWPEPRQLLNSVLQKSLCPHAELPRLVFFSLRGANFHDIHRYYESFWQAVEELAVGLKLMRDLL